MKKNLADYLHLLIFFNKKIPNLIDNSERIIRTIYSRINLNNKNELKNNFFKPPIGSEKISVNRLDYTTIKFCKKIGKKHQHEEQDRAYYGFAALIAKEIRNFDFDIDYDPIKGNRYHANIKIGYVSRRGQQLPADITYKIEKLKKIARIYIDPDTNSKKWYGDEVK